MSLCIASVFFLTAVGVALTGVPPVSAVCNQTDVVAWDVLPDDVQADGDGEFSTTLRLEWSFRDPPFMGAAEAASSGHDNVINDTYVPDVFFPSTCTGYEDIDVSGDLVSLLSNGTVNSLGWVWDSGDPPPYAEDIHELTVLKP